MDELAVLKSRAEAINNVLKSFCRTDSSSLLISSLSSGAIREKFCLVMKSAPIPAASGILIPDEKMDKDRFRFDLGGVEDAYSEVQRRVLDLD